MSKSYKKQLNDEIKISFVTKIELDKNIKLLRKENNLTYKEVYNECLKIGCKYLLLNYSEK